MPALVAIALLACTRDAPVVEFGQECDGDGYACVVWEGGDIEEAKCFGTWEPLDTGAEVNFCCELDGSSATGATFNRDCATIVD